MNTDPDTLLQKIEKVRKEMVELASSSSFVDERVVRMSDQLDKLLIRYQLLTMRTSEQ